MLLRDVIMTTPPMRPTRCALVVSVLVIKTRAGLYKTAMVTHYVPGMLTEIFAWEILARGGCKRLRRFPIASALCARMTDHGHRQP